MAGEIWQGGRALYQKQIAQLQLTEKVTLVDEYLPNEVLAACIQRADVVVLPYRQATQSGILQVAFGQGKPVITTAVGGLAEVVQHGFTGLIVPSEAPQQLAEAIDRFFAEDLGSFFVENVKEENGRFDWEYLCEMLSGFDQAMRTLAHHYLCCPACYQRLEGNHCLACQIEFPQTMGILDLRWPPSAAGG